MKPGLSLRISQHLALTPQLQQSIRLLQLSTLELAQEIEQMLQYNPFLEHSEPELGAEEILALERDAREEAAAQHNEEESWNAIDSIANEIDLAGAEGQFDLKNVLSNEVLSKLGDDSAQAADSPVDAISDQPSDWEGDGSLEIPSGDDEWGQTSAQAASAANANVSDDDAQPGTRSGGHESLQQHLQRQAAGLRLSPADRAALTVLIESLDEDGYLQDGFEELATSLGASTLEEVEEIVVQLSIAHQWLLQMEPTGVGAWNLTHCLQLQLRALEEDGRIHPEEAQAGLALLAQPLELLAKRDLKKLSAACKLPPEEVRSAMALIARLEPKPARSFAQVEQQIVVPDVIVKAVQRRGQIQFVAQLNAQVMPRLAIHDAYASALKSAKKNEAVQNLQGRLQEARWFIKNVQQRFDTILRVSQAIVERQLSFFKHGAVAMRPLVLREIADEIGMHESTISRVTTAKYMATPWGTYELKYFFGSALATETGGNASSTAVRELIRQFIDAESKSKPLSDNAIADMLKEQGIECARRTVAKYREALRIPVTSLRKER
jgi:RNA polymerase sigma-54 factor